MYKPETNKKLTPDQYKIVINSGARRSGKTATFREMLKLKGYSDEQIKDIISKM